MFGPCEFCPPDLTADQLQVCGNPTVECSSRLAALRDKLEAWSSMRQAGEVARDGTLPLRVLKPGDRLQLFLADMDDPDPESFERVLDLWVYDTEQEVTAGVVNDSYDTVPVEEHSSSFALPIGATITLYGSYDHQARERRHDLQRHLGLAYIWRNRVTYTFTGPIKEIKLIRGEVVMNMFNTGIK